LSKEAFIQIIQANQGIINSICRVYFSTEEDVKDARQEVILQLWKSFPSFRGEAKPSTWIYRVALNTVLNMRRNLNRQPQLVEGQEKTNALSTSFSDDDVMQLQQLIRLLNDKDKALVLLFLEGYSHKEIAITLNTTPTNISTRFNRIKQRLKKLYKKYTHES
jgi:RNA polymerase sigma-70 factor (ECF subfamily)